MNQLQKALVKAGLANPPKTYKARKSKKRFVCKKCGASMVISENTNVMYCPECDKSYFLFK